MGSNARAPSSETKDLLRLPCHRDWPVSRTPCLEMSPQAKRRVMRGFVLGRGARGVIESSSPNRWSDRGRNTSQISDHVSRSKAVGF